VFIYSSFLFLVCSSSSGSSSSSSSSGSYRRLYMCMERNRVSSCGPESGEVQGAFFGVSRKVDGD